MAHHNSTLTQLITSSSYEKTAILNAKHGEINLLVAICLKSQQ